MRATESATPRRFHYAWVILIVGTLVVFASLGLARFGYTQLKPFRGSSAEAGHDMVRQFTEKFPALKSKLGTGAEAVATLNKEIGNAMKKDMEWANGRKITGTPVLYVDNVEVRGFQAKKIAELLKR